MSHSHCGDESHDHDHGEGGHHSHSPPPDAIPGDSLYGKIDLDRVRCLNENVDGSARKVIKPWDKRLDEEQVYFVFITLTIYPCERLGCAVDNLYSVSASVQIVVDN